MARILGRTKRSPAERSFKTAQGPNSRNRPSFNPQLVSAVIDVAGTGLVLTFDRPIMLRGTTTGITTDAVNADEVSAVRTADNEITVTFDAPLATATMLTFPSYMGNIRSRDGGFAVIPTFPVSGP